MRVTSYGAWATWDAYQTAERLNQQRLGATMSPYAPGVIRSKVWITITIIHTSHTSVVK